MSDTPFRVKKPASVTKLRDKPDVNKPADNLPGERLVGMTFNMPRDWHTEFKVRAAMEGISMRELLERCFEAYKKLNG